MKKKFLLLIATLLAITALSACGNSSRNEGPNENKEDSNENKIVITEEFLEEELAGKITSTIDAQIIRRMNEFASARKAHVAGWEDGAQFTDYEITSAERTDVYTVRVYGKLYGSTDYGDVATSKFSLKIWCEKNTENEKEYTMEIEWGLGGELTIG